MVAAREASVDRLDFLVIIDFASESVVGVDWDRVDVDDMIIREESEFSKEEFEHDDNGADFTFRYSRTGASTIPPIALEMSYIEERYAAIEAVTGSHRLFSKTI